MLKRVCRTFTHARKYTHARLTHEMLQISRIKVVRNVKNVQDLKRNILNMGIQPFELVSHAGGDTLKKLYNDNNK